MIEALRGAPAEVVVDLANRALADGQLIRDRVDQPAPSHAIFALGMVDAADEAGAAIELATEAARKTGSRYAAACVAGARTSWEHDFGDLRRAEDEARLVIDVFRSTAGPGGVDDGGALGLATALLDAVASTRPSACSQTFRPTGDPPHETAGCAALRCGPGSGSRRGGPRRR
jgi:hypothetical protein